MRVLSIFLLSLSMLTKLSAAEGDTTFVQVHNLVDMTWYANYDRVGVFPNDSSKQYRKIWMHYTLGCATGGCSDWDYTTQIFLMHPSGQFDSTVSSLDTISLSPLVIDTSWNVYEVMQPFEMGRVITPYGSMLSNSFSREFVFDVTDLKDLLSDSVTIRAFYSGWSSGFSVSLRFAFIEGTPPRNVLGVENIYKGDATYNNSAAFEANFFNNKTIPAPTNFSSARIFSTITGHGFDNNYNCAEFCIRNYTVKINGNNAGSANIWRDDCGSNPIYPQGGTWLYDRAGWCPGERAVTDEFEVGSLIQNGSNNIDFDMQNYTWTGNQAPVYTVNSRIVYYGPYNFANDAYLLDIIAPSNKYAYSRLNPVCGKPKLLVQNTGSNTLTAITFQYRVDGAAECQYTWTGSLASLQKAEIELPNVNWVNANFSNQKFYAEIIAVNGTADEYSFNNTASSGYNMPVIHNIDTMYIELATNNFGAETGYQLLDGDGNIVFQRAAGTLASNTLYTDRIGFARGCYTLKVTDSGKDGLSYWADPAAGSGYIKITRFVPQFGLFIPVKEFGSEFGNFINYPFIVGPNKENVDDNMTTSACVLSDVNNSMPTSFESSVFPNPNNGSFNVRLNFEKAQDVNCKVYNALGQLVCSKSFSQISSESSEIVLENKAKGIYIVQFETDTRRWSHKVIVE